MVRSRRCRFAGYRSVPRSSRVGACISGPGPKCKKVEVVLEGETIAGSEMLQRVVELEPGEDGYFAGLAADAVDGSLYRYRLDEGKTLPRSRIKVSAAWPRRSFPGC